MINSAEVLAAYERIRDAVKETPILESGLLNNALGHKIIFKAESFQKTGAYKIRGAINCLMNLSEQGNLPKKIVAYSSGNHAQALAYAASLHNIPATIFMPKYTSNVKRESAKNYGAEVIITDTRSEAEAKVIEYENNGYYNLHPSSNDMVIAGNGTICYEAIRQANTKIDAIFAACGGGGLLSGTYIATKLFGNDILTYGGEPENANDAIISVAQGKIYKFDQSPDTIADGARTLGITAKNFEYLKEIAGIYSVPEDEILYWNAWVMHLLKIVCEPTAALSIAAAARWLNTQNKPQTIIVIISGGNIDKMAYEKICLTKYLEIFPSNDINIRLSKAG